MTESFAPGMYYEDFSVGDTFTTGGRTISESTVDMFAGLTGDFSYVHTDAEAAKATIFGERIAHGLLSLCVLQGLMWQTRYSAETGIATLGWESIKFVDAVKLGDTVHAEFTIREMRVSKSHPDAGIMVEDCRLLNASGKPVLSGDHILMLKRRPA